MFSTRCPYCGKYNKNNFTFKKCSNYRDIVCNECGSKYKVSFYVQDTVYTYDEELKKVLPQDKIEIIKNVIGKYLNYKGKGGYENSRTILISSEIKEYMSSSDNAIVISLTGKAEYYGNEFRIVRFYVTYNNVRAEVTSEFTWNQRSWFVGETLEEKVDNYIQQALIKWETI